jgi:hypothetical protein
MRRGGNVQTFDASGRAHVDPASLALAAATLIATGAAEGAAAALGEAVRGGIGRISQAVRARFTGDPAVEESLTRLEAKPDSQARAAELAENLKERLDADPAFADELERLLAELPDDASVPGASFVTTVKDNARVGKVTNIQRVQGNVQF